MVLSCPVVTPGPTPGPPPVAGNRCQRLYYECRCIAGVPTWVEIFRQCPPNGACTGAYFCNNTQFYLELINGCLGLVPVLVTTAANPVPHQMSPADMNPVCPPKCCPPLNGCLTFEYKCECNDNISTWVAINSGNCVQNKDCDPATNISTQSHYKKSTRNACTVGVKVTAAQIAANVPPLAASCCGICQGTYYATCVNGSWNVSDGMPFNCVTTCTENVDWLPVDDCHMFRVGCGPDGGCTIGLPKTCNRSASVQPVQPTAPPGPTPEANPCCYPPPRMCRYYWRAECDAGVWSVSSTPVASSGTCIDSCEETDWFTTPSCTQYRYTCEECSAHADCPAATATQPAAPVSIPDCCNNAFCNCEYSSTWDCDLSAWGSPVPAGPCYEGVDDSYDWVATPGSCEATTIVSAEGACD